MLDKTYFDKLRNKYNYNDKVINALGKIIPSIIKYYGEEYESLILDAIFNTEIIACSSKETISKVLNEKESTPLTRTSKVGDIDLKRKESVYVPNIKIKYDEISNTYKIEDLNRVIVTSHTFNYDSPKGIEVLTHALCHLVKSYKDEVQIFENTVTIRNGISYEKRKIVYGENITLELIEDFGKGLEEGFNLFDTEMIVSMVLGDVYKSYDYDSINAIAVVLKDKYDLLKEINSYEMLGDIDKFCNSYNKDSIDRLSDICDECVLMEDEMIMAYKREDKDLLKDALNKKLSEEAYVELLSIYKSSKKR